LDVTIGWDISTAAIGICVKREGKEHEFHVIFPKGDEALDKWRYANQAIHEIIGEIMEPEESAVHVVEQRLGGFTGGLTTKQTLMALAAMNAVVSVALSHSGQVHYILPVTAKALTKFKDRQKDGEDKKETVVRLAKAACPGFPYKEKKVSGKPKKGKGKTYPWVKGVDDMADAWLLVEAFQAQKDKASSEQSKKAASGKGKARRTEADGSEEE
jgi:hypothetical protein